MSIFYLEVLRPTIEKELLPAISSVVESIVSPIELRQQCTVQDISDFLGMIHEKVMMQLFKQELGTAPTSMDLNASDDDSDSDEGPRLNNWIVEKFL